MEVGSGEVLGVIGCLVLADEIVYVLERDDGIDNIYVVDNAEGRIMLEKLDRTALGSKVYLVPPGSLAEERFPTRSVIVSMKPAGLHDRPSDMLTNIAGSIAELKDTCGSVLVFYGLCRNTRQSVQRVIDAADVPVTFLTEANGDIADDCFGAIMGSRKRYLQMMKNNNGTMFISTGYAEHWDRRQRDKRLDRVMMQIENYQILFNALGYHKVMVLDNGIGDREAFMGRVRTFASIFGFRVETLRCDMSVFERSYSMAKGRLLQRIAGSVGEEESVLSRTLP